jgi:hypothetical protein
MPTYNLAPPPDQSPSPIPHGELAIVLADLSTGCFSPALNGSLLLHASRPAALADLRDGWIKTLCDHGAQPLRATAFVMREESRVRESLHAADIS